MSYHSFSIVQRADVVQIIRQWVDGVLKSRVCGDLTMISTLKSVHQLTVLEPGHYSGLRRDLLPQLTASVAYFTNAFRKVSFFPIRIRRSLKTCRRAHSKFYNPPLPRNPPLLLCARISRLCLGPHWQALRLLNLARLRARKLPLYDRRFPRNRG